MSKLLLEIRRKGLHFLWGLFLAFLYWQDFADWRLFTVYFLLALIVSFGYRATRHRKHPAFSLLFEKMERHESKRAPIPGLSGLHFQAAYLLLVLLFPKPAAIAGMILLAVGDPVAFWWGVWLGRLPAPWNRKKDLDARLLAAILCTLLLLALLPWWQALVASLIGMLLESFDYKKNAILIDDNLFTPLAAAAVVWLLALL